MKTVVNVTVWLASMIMETSPYACVVMLLGF